MSPSMALALFALLVAIFAVFAVGAVYARLRLLERTALNTSTTRLADEPLLAPEAVRPGGADLAALVVLVDTTCAVCGAVLDSVAEHQAAGELADLRVVAVFPARDTTHAARDSAVERLESVTDPDVWAALYEGYAPCIFLINRVGHVVDRRFIYGDTDLPTLLTRLVHAYSAAPVSSTSVSSSAGSNHAARPHSAHRQ